MESLDIYDRKILLKENCLFCLNSVIWVIIKWSPAGIIFDHNSHEVATWYEIYTWQMHVWHYNTKIMILSVHYMRQASFSSARKTSLDWNSSLWKKSRFIIASLEIWITAYNYPQWILWFTMRLPSLSEDCFFKSYFS